MKNPSIIQQAAGALVFALGLTGHATAQPPEPACAGCAKVVIHFGTLEIGNKVRTCPLYVKEPVIRLDEGATRPTNIKWVGKIKGANGWERYTKGYRILFSPFETTDGSNPIRANERGVAMSPTIMGSADSELPLPDRYWDIGFKYTIIGKECKRFPLDPLIRVR